MDIGNLKSVFYCVIFGFIVIVFKVIYQLTLHPLAKYPGPFFSRVTSLSTALQAASGDRHLHQLKEHLKYGPVVRIGPSALSFASPAALRTIYQSNRVDNPLRKSDYYKTVDAPSGAYSTHTEISRKKHAFRRRVLDHAFSEASMKAAEQFIVQNIDILCQVLAPQENQPGTWSVAHDMSEYCTYFAYDVMGDLVFGKRFECLTKDEHRYVPKLITSSSWFLYWVSHLPLQHLVRPSICSPSLMNWIGGETAQAEHAFVKYASSCVKSRLAKEQEGGKEIRKDMMHFILNARDPVTGMPFTESDLDAESSLLIAAGADTSSTVLAAAFFYLTLPSSEEILKHLQGLLREQFVNVSSITWSTVKKVSYLRAIIDETLRLAPAAPSELPRTILQKPGLDIAGEFIPEGTTVGCAAYVLHHDEDAYPESFSFRPERWIAADDELKPRTSTHLEHISPLQHPDQIARAREAFCAFSLGSRGCVGKTLAYMELSLALARVLWAFDVQRAENLQQPSVRSKIYADKQGLMWRENEYQLTDVFITDRAGPLVQFKHRS